MVIGKELFIFFVISSFFLLLAYVYNIHRLLALVTLKLLQKKIIEFMYDFFCGFKKIYNVILQN